MRRAIAIDVLLQQYAQRSAGDARADEQRRALCGEDEGRKEYQSMRG